MKIPLSRPLRALCLLPLALLALSCELNDPRAKLLDPNDPNKNSEDLQWKGSCEVASQGYCFSYHGQFLASQVCPANGSQVIVSQCSRVQCVGSCQFTDSSAGKKDGYKYFFYSPSYTVDGARLFCEGRSAAVFSPSCL